MTLPNRRNYTSGQQKRARKCVVTAAAAGPPPPSVAPRTRASGKQRAGATRAISNGDLKRAAAPLSLLQAEMIAELAAFSPLHELPPEAAAVPHLHHHPTQQQHAAHASLAPLLASKQQLQQRAETARLRLLDDELFQQQGVRGNRLLAMDSATQSDGVDPLRAAVELLPTLDTSAEGDDAMESVLADLQSIGAACVQELVAPLSAVGDARVSAAYHDAVGALQMWHARQLQQSRQALLLGSASSSSSPSTSGGSTASSSSALSASFLHTGGRQQAKKRANLSKTAKMVLKTWFDNHLHHPYPSEDEKDTLARRGGITLEQVNNWFINTRGRKWKPMLSRLMAEKEAGECKLFDQMVQRIEEPYRRAPTKR